MCGNRYSVPSRYAGESVDIYIGLDDSLRIYASLNYNPDLPPIATHTLQSSQQGWSTVPEHHADLWDNTLQVEKRSLNEYEEATQWN